MIHEPPPLSLYVHLPWCVKKCPYCDFNAHPLRGVVPEAAYIQKLLEDLEQDLPKVWGREVVSIFFGGGTPSLFSPDSFEYLLSRIRAYLPLSQNIEITLEANPGTIERGKFSGYRQAGVNRISLGVQSFSSRQLQILGRIHDASGALSAIEEIQDAGFENYNIDLMHGLPEQDLSGALKDLKTAIDLKAPHISWYQLTLESNTLFAVQKPQLPSDDILADIEEAGFEMLKEAGYERYEISAFAQKNTLGKGVMSHRSVHNQNYWMFGDYLGIGAGAHAKITEVATQEIHRFFKFKHPKIYLASHQNFIQQHERLSPDALPLEFMLNALRLADGFLIRHFEERTGLDWDVVREPINEAISRELLVIETGLEGIGKGWVRPTPLGFRFLNELLLLFG
jgi:putative oxygen-independent coproporphyrinogen III oxidase